MIAALRQSAHRWLWRLMHRPRLDYPLLGAIALLGAIGLATLYSAEPRLVVNQGVRFALGGALMLLISRIPPSTLRNWTPWLYAGSVALLLLVALLGEGRGAHRWLDLKFVRFQPSELLKLTMPMMMAWYLNRRPLPPDWTTLAVAVALIAVPAGLIAEQPDLGTALLIVASGLFGIFLAGLSWWRIGLIGGSVAAAAPVAWVFMHEYQRNRVRMLLDPDSDPLGLGWHIIQSKIAVGSGGIWGKGWHRGTQSQLDFLPEHTTDFVFSLYSEEFGLVGVVLLLALYLFIIGRSLWIAANAKDTYSRLLAGAISLSFCVYVIVNGGMISGMLPVVGVPLPLMSYGGTSAVSLLAGFGVLMSIHAHRKMVAR